MVEWLTGKEAKERLYELNFNDGFAIRFDTGNITATHYAVVTKTYSRDRRTNTVVNCEASANPQMFREVKKGSQNRIVYDQETEELYYRQTQSNNQKVIGICFTPSKVDYNSGNKLYAECEECGQRYRQPVSEDELPIKGERLIKDAEGMAVTPCCRADWKPVLEQSE